MAKLREETDELAEGIEAGDRENIAEEIGDVLFSAVNAARMLGVDPEAALHAACEKFTRRFAFLEQKVAEVGADFRDLSLSELERYYQEARKCLEGKDAHFYLDKTQKV